MLWNGPKQLRYISRIKHMHKPIRILVGIQFLRESAFSCTKQFLALSTNMKRWRVFMIRLTVFMIRLTLSITRIVPAGKVWAISWEKFGIESRKVWLNYSSSSHRVQTSHFKSCTNAKQTYNNTYYLLQAIVCVSASNFPIILRRSLFWNEIRKEKQNKVNTWLTLDILNRNASR